MAITPFPDPAPSRNDSEPVFVARANSLLGHLPTFVTEANALAVDVNGDAVAAAGSASDAAGSASDAAGSAVDAAQSALIAQGAANYQGDYDAGTFYAVGESVTYLGSQFVKKTTAPAGTTPVDGTDWLGFGGDGVDVQEFTSSGTWTKPAGATVVQVYAVGPGGGGDNVVGTNTSNGGAGGEGVLFTLLASDLGATESVVIGVGGAGAPNGSNADGADGGNTTFGSITAFGGAGGGRTSNKSLPTRVSVPSASNSPYVALYGASGLPSVYGGGGGGAAFPSSAALGGGSEFAGNGGDGDSTAATKAGDGATPGGGGGASTNDGGGGDGGDGYCRVISW